MASIVKRKNSYAVVYGYINPEGERKQKWETYKNESSAIIRMEEINNPIQFLDNKKYIYKFNDLLDEYINLYGKIKWSFSTYDNNARLINKYIRPILGEIPLIRVNRHLLSHYFSKLHTHNELQPSDITIHEVYKLLNSIFKQAIYWGYFDELLTEHINLKQPRYSHREALSPEQIACVINYATEQKNYSLALSVHLAFSCSMRKGEILGLCWNDLDFSATTISVNKELIRVSKESLSTLNRRDVYHCFSSCYEDSKSLLILKKPKTDSSIRTAYMTPTLASLLKLVKEEQKFHESINSEKFKMVLTQPNGRPLSPDKCNKEFNNILHELGFPKVVFHSLRCSSTSFKLMISGGNIKAVQGDTGHAQPNMVLSVYARINDQDRRMIAEEMENKFCSKLTLAQ